MAVAPSLPDWTENMAPGAWGMLANDHVGDCTIAGVGHAIATWRSFTPPFTLMTDKEAIAAYTAITGYTPSNPATDQGAIITDVLNYWHNTGIVCGGKLDKLTGYKGIDPKDHNMITAAVAGDGIVMCGVILHEAQMQGEGPWSTFTGPEEGGHCVVINQVTKLGPVCVTWGALMPITWEWWDACCEEAYGLLSPDWVHPA